MQDIKGNYYFKRKFPWRGSSKNFGKDAEHSTTSGKNGSEIFVLKHQKGYISKSIAPITLKSVGIDFYTLFWSKKKFWSVQ